MLEENIGEIDLNNQDGAAEIINIIFGQTKAVLNQRGYRLERAIPSVMRGKGHKIYQNTKIPVLLVPFRSNLGKFWIQICVKAI
jgi:chemotaxis protein CheX